MTEEVPGWLQSFKKSVFKFDLNFLNLNSVPPTNTTNMIGAKLGPSSTSEPKLFRKQTVLRKARVNYTGGD